LYSFATPENNLLQSVITNLEAKFQQALEAQPQQEKDICLNRPGSTHPFYIRKTQLYGKFSATAGGTSTTVAPDLVHAYRLAYYNDAVASQSNALKFYRYGDVTDASIATKEDFDSENVSDCERYRFSVSSQLGDTNVSESKVQEVIGKMRENCGKACETRAGEFRQAIIRNLFAQNPATLIEHYNVYFDTNLNGNPGFPEPEIQAMYVGVWDANVNVTGYTLSECELDAMVDKLIAHCKNTYCNTPLTENDVTTPQGTQRRYGTDAELANLRKPLEYNFEVDVKAAGQSCAGGWDVVNTEQSTGWSLAKMIMGKGYLDEFRNTDKIEYSDGYYYYSSVLRKLPLGSGIGNFVNFNDGTSFINNDDFLDYFIVKFDRQGNIIWKRHIEVTAQSTLTAQAPSTNALSSFGDSPNNTGVNLNFDPQTGRYIFSAHRTNLFTPTTVRFNGSFVFDLSSFEWGYIGAIDTDGNLIWMKKENIVTENRLDILKNSAIYSAREIHTGTNIYKFEFTKRFLSTGEIDGTFASDNFQIHGSLGTPSPQWVAHGSDFYFVADFKNSGNPIIFKINGTDVATFTGTSTHPDCYVIVRFNAQGKYQSINMIPSNTTQQGCCIGGLSAKMVSWNGNLFLLFRNDANSMNIAANIIVNGSAFSIPLYEVFVFRQTTPDTYIFQTSYNRGKSTNNWFLEEPGRLVMTSIQPSSADLLYFDLTNQTFSTDVVQNISSNVRPFRYRSGDFIGIADNGNGPFIPGITFQPITGAFKIFIGQYGIACPITRALCFRFTDPKELSVSVPAEMQPDYVFNPVQENCQNASVAFLRNSLQQQKEQLIAKRLQRFRTEYFNSCGDLSQLQDKLTISYPTGVHHFTLYYYDRAGNRVRTVPPEGVSFLDVSTAAAVATARNAQTINWLPNASTTAWVNLLMNTAPMRTTMPPLLRSTCAPALRLPKARSMPPSITLRLFITTKGRSAFRAMPNRRKPAPIRITNTISWVA
jgi:hypothetical protein